MDAEQLAEIRENFDHFDRDDNGRIDCDEFISLLDALGANATREECRIGFDEIDEDDNGWIEFDEFATWWSDRY